MRLRSQVWRCGRLPRRYFSALGTERGRPLTQGGRLRPAARGAGRDGRHAAGGAAGGEAGREAGDGH